MIAPDCDCASELARLRNRERRLERELLEAQARVAALEALPRAVQAADYPADNPRGIFACADGVRDLRWRPLP